MIRPLPSPSAQPHSLRERDPENEQGHESRRRHDPIPTGIPPFDRRTGGLRTGGTYLIAGTPGPAKLVAGLHFLRDGLARGETAALVTNADAQGMLGVAEAWGLDLREPFRAGRFRIVGFRDDFQLRALRTTEPEAIFEELDRVLPGDVHRIVVDPASTFLSLGVPSQLGRSFLAWANGRPATVCGTLAVEGPDRLPSNADWLLNSSTGIVVVSHRQGRLHQLELVHAIPDADQDLRPVTVELVPGAGLRPPERFPSRRAEDRASDPPTADPGRLLLLSVDGAHAKDLERWARETFSTEVMTDPLSAITRLQGGARFGGIIVHAGRNGVMTAIRVCRALRPLTAGAIIFATDQSIRSNDRIRILDAGADDCMSGVLDFGELGTRIRYSMETGGRRRTPRQDDEMPTLRGGRVPRAALAAEARRRATMPETSTYALLRFPAGTGSRHGLIEAVQAEIRTENGDLVSGEDGECLVLLQGARASSAPVFLDRLRGRFPGRDGSSGELQPDIWDHPGDRAEIERLFDVSLSAAPRQGVGVSGDPDEPA